MTEGESEAGTRPPDHRVGRAGRVGLLAALVALLGAETAIAATGPESYWAMAGVKAGLLGVLPLILALAVYRRPAVFWGRANRRRTLVCVAAGLAVAGIVYAGALLTTLFVPYEATAAALDRQGTGSLADYWPVLLYFPVVNSLLEEFFFRGVFATATGMVLGPKTTVAVASGAFALYHVSIIGGWFGVGLTAAMVAGLFLVGSALHWTRLWSGSVAGSWAAHAGADLGIGVFALTNLLS
jgi:membrane protease YdiL (CAAX protease family)